MGSRRKGRWAAASWLAALAAIVVAGVLGLALVVPSDDVSQVPAVFEAPTATGPRAEERWSEPRPAPAPAARPNAIEAKVPSAPEAVAPAPGAIPDATAIAGRVATRSGGPLPDGLRVLILRIGAKGKLEFVGQAVPWSDASFATGPIPAGRGYRVVAQTLFGNDAASVEGISSGARDVLLELDPGETISGTVFDPTGSPVGAGVEVVAIADDPRFARHDCRSTTKTRADGSFALEYLGEFEFSVGASRKVAVGKEAAAVPGVRNGSTRVTLRLRPEGAAAVIDANAAGEPLFEPAATAITGRLVTRMGNELPADFALDVVADAGGRSRTLIPKPDGSFDTGTLQPGTYSLRARSANRLPSGEQRRVAAGSRGVLVTLDSHGSVAGQVLDSQGVPVGKGVKVVASAEKGAREIGPGGYSTARTREDGTFLVEYLGEYEFRLTAVPEGRVGTDIVGWPLTGVRPGRRGVTLRVERAVVLTGRVVTADGAPCHPCGVHATQDRFGGSVRVETGKDGCFTIRGLAPGSVRLEATSRQQSVAGEFQAPSENVRLQYAPK